MGKDKIKAAVIHTVSHPDRDALRDEINRVHARHIRRCLDESGMDAEGRKQALDELIARLRGDCTFFLKEKGTEKEL